MRYQYYILLAILVLFILIVYIIFNNPFGVQVNHISLPDNVQYAIEYLNARVQNSTILVPSIYSQASLLSENGNKVIVNDTMYADILFNNKRYPNINYVLIGLPVIDNLSYYYSLIHLAAPSVEFFNSSYTIKNLSSGYRNCALFKSNFNALLYCEIYFYDKPIGYITFANLPPNVTKTNVINASLLVFDDYQQQYVKSMISQNSSNLLGGIAFIYPNVAVMYIPENLYNTFYGKYEFSMDSDAVVDDFYGFKVVNLSNFS